MDNILSTLNDEEVTLLEKVKSTTGTIETIQELLEKQNIPNSYNNIFIAYCRLNEDLEALKRALFIQWYASCEPTAFSGIGLLDKDYQKKNLLKLMDALTSDKADSELKAMVKHYYAVADYYFNAFINSSIIEKYLGRNHTTIISFNNRGQMGAYWKSLAISNK
jgi:hypothetical protein